MVPPLPCPDEDSCILYLLRHGATANNLLTPPRLQGRHENAGLSESGRQQAEAAARLFAGSLISAVYSSPLLRATETAQPIASSHQLTVLEITDLIEADVGNWAGRHWEEIASSDSNAYGLFMDDPGLNPYSGGESFGDVADRILPVFDRLLSLHTGESIVVVGHNVVNRVYLAKLMGIPLCNSRQIKQSNCGVNVIRGDLNRNRLITLNSVFHLGFD